MWSGGGRIILESSTRVDVATSSFCFLLQEKYDRLDKKFANMNFSDVRVGSDFSISPLVGLFLGISLLLSLFDSPSELSPAVDSANDKQQF